MVATSTDVLKNERNSFSPLSTMKSDWMPVLQDV